MKAIKFMMVLAVMLSAFTFGAQAQSKKKQMAEAKFSVYLHCDDEKKKAEGSNNCKGNENSAVADIAIKLTEV